MSEEVQPRQHRGVLGRRISAGQSLDARDRAGSAARGERRKSAVFILLSLVIVLSPLPLGAARPVAWDTMALAVALLLVASLTLSAEEIHAFAVPLAVPVVLFAAVVGYVLLQISGWTPAAWQNPIWDLAREGLGAQIPGAIAVAPQAGLVGLLRLLTYGGIFLLALLLCRSAQRALAAAKLVAFFGSAYAAYGIVAYSFGNNSILWLTKWAYQNDLTGTFVNHNSFATYLGLCLLATLTYPIILLQSIRFNGTWRERVGTVIEFVSHHPAMLVSLFFSATALLLTHSRGGFIATLVGILAFALALSLSPSLHRLRRLKIALVPIALLLFAFFVSGGRVVDRLVGTGADADGRPAIYGITWRAFSDHPLLGTGFNSFESVFPIYRTTEIAGHVDMAHNDYLQNLLELGAPVAAVYFLILLWLVGLCVRGVFVRQRDAAFPCLGIAATVLVAVHSLVDFSLQIPAVTATYLFLIGAAVAQSQSTRA